MPTRLKKLRIDDVSSVSRGANPKAQVTFWKRESGFRNEERDYDPAQAVRALDVAIASIVADDDVTDKRGAVAESLRQFADYVSKNGMNVGAADAAAAEVIKRHAAFIHTKESTVKHETTVEKAARGERIGKSLQAAIDDYAKANNCSIAKAADRVLLSSQVSEYH